MTSEVLRLGIAAILINALIVAILLYFARSWVKAGSAAGIGWTFNHDTQFWLFWMQTLAVLAIAEVLLLEIGFVVVTLFRVL
jgi:hypothetical protein